jgi:hypothetical protein
MYKSRADLNDPEPVFFSDDKNRSLNASSEIQWLASEPLSLRASEGNPEDRVIRSRKIPALGSG